MASTYDPRPTLFQCRDCRRYLTRTEAAKSATCARCRVQAQRAADRPATCAAHGCSSPPTVLDVGPPTRWICQAHADQQLAEARADAARAWGCK